MIEDKSVLAVICARGGSKGLPGKNVLALGGRPMVAWSVAAGKSSQTVDRLILSTDDPAIAQAARQAGCEVPFLRPPELASDTARIEDALVHAMDQLERSYAYLILLQATSPFRLPADIDACVRLCHESGAPTAITVCPPSKSPYIMLRVDPEGRVERLLKDKVDASSRQNLPPVQQINGAVYVARCDWFRQHRVFYTEETRALIMPPERSVDIDTPLDFAFAKALLESGLVSPSI
jgi:CMP-N,N'-diacetyllegionaminic acid synthase